MTKKHTNKAGLFFLSFLMLISFASAQVMSPFNKLLISDTSSSESYSFIVSGHFHGESTSQSTFPASTILAGIDTINKSNASFIMSLGDMFIDVNETYLTNYKKSLFSKLKIPIFNAVGNHDLSNGNVYEKVYGKTYFSFLKKSELFIILNTEDADGSIKDGQFEFLKNMLADAKSEKIKNVFIFSHRPIWAENNVLYQKLFKGNTRTAFGENNYVDEIEPLLTELSKSKTVYWMSGSMADAPVSFFYHQQPETNIVFMQTAIRDLPRDAVLQVKIIDGEVSFNGISLTGQTLLPITNYNLEYWNQHSVVDKPFSFRLLPYLTIKMLSHYYFWIGFTTSLFLLLLLRFIYNRWKRRG